MEEEERSKYICNACLNVRMDGAFCYELASQFFFLYFFFFFFRTSHDIGGH